MTFTLWIIWCTVSSCLVPGPYKLDKVNVYVHIYMYILIFCYSIAKIAIPPPLPCERSFFIMTKSFQPNRNLSHPLEYATTILHFHIFASFWRYPWLRRWLACRRGGSGSQVVSQSAAGTRDTGQYRHQNWIGDLLLSKYYEEGSQGTGSLDQGP